MMSKSSRPAPSKAICCSTALAIAAFLTACGNKGNESPAAAGAASAPMAASSAASAAGGTATPAPPVTVTTVKVEKKDLSVRFRASGVVTPIRMVDVKPQTNSVVTKVHVRDGQYVKAGDLLFTLDARTEEANIAKAQAQLAKDVAALADAQRQLRRAQDLLAKQFISQGSVDTNVAAVEGLQATVNADKAAIEAVRVAQSYSRITAPQAGRVGAINVNPGTALEASKTVLLTITQISPIAVTFALPQSKISAALEGLKGGGAPVTATLSDSGTVFKGTLQFVDSMVDPTSGVVRAKAFFKNEDEKLWPGAFVDISQTMGELKEALVIPQAAVIYAARGPIVYVIEDGKAVQRPIKIVQSQAAEVAVTGLAEGDAVVLEGRQNLRPGSAVVERPKEGKDKDAKDAPATAASAAASASSGATDSKPKASAP
jgi:RND family efflux transporter MFP subunit